MSKEADAIKGRLKNSRNQLKSIIARMRRGDEIYMSDIEYALSETNAAIEDLEEL